MEKSTFNFSLVDFLAYVFPGVNMLIAFWIIAIIIPIHNDTISHLNLTWEMGLAAIPLAYLLGMLSSNIHLLIGYRQNKIDEIENPFENKLTKIVAEDIKRAFEDYFGDKGKWCKQQFYLMRSVVHELSPASARLAERQNSLRQMRKNSIAVSFIWGAVGIIYGIKLLLQRDVLTLYGVLIIIISLIISVWIAHILMIGTMRNREIEVRDVCFAFINLNKLGRLKAKANQV